MNQNNIKNVDYFTSLTQMIYSLIIKKKIICFIFLCAFLVISHIRVKAKSSKKNNIKTEFKFEHPVRLQIQENS